MPGPNKPRGKERLRKRLFWERNKRPHRVAARKRGGNKERSGLGKKGEENGRAIKRVRNQCLILRAQGRSEVPKKRPRGKKEI